MLSQTELAEVVAACRRHDRHAQNRLYQAFGGWAHALCRRYTSDDAEASDCVQTGFVKVFTKIDRYGGDQSFEAWFKKIMVNTCIDRYRARIREQPTDEIERAADLSAAPQALINIEAEHLLELVRQLSPAYRAAFSLFAVDGFEYQEIAEMLGVNIGTVKSNISKARQKLKNMLSEEA